MILTPQVEFIIKKLNENGHRADVVGGPVRDFLRGVAPSDYDITTSALPAETKAAFAEFKTVDTGIKHGTVTLVLEGVPYEITTYRIDGEYKDARHPESVQFTKAIEEDLARRDFTVNAIAYNPRDGITDPFFGREDIKKGIIRAVGDPEIRFSEDALRILRALRFSATLGFEIEENTARALRCKAYLLREISAERIFTEWKKLLSGEFAYSVLSEYADLIPAFIPNIEALKLPERESFAKGFMLRQAQLFYLSCENPALSCEGAMRALKTDSYTREMSAKILGNVGKYRIAELSDAGHMLSALGEDACELVLQLEAALGISEGKSLEILREYLEKGLPYKLSDLSVGGGEMKALGLSGKAVGDALSALLSVVISGEVSNSSEELLAYTKAKIM